MNPPLNPDVFVRAAERIDQGLNKYPWTAIPDHLNVNGSFRYLVAFADVVHGPDVEARWDYVDPEHGILALLLCAEILREQRREKK